MTALYVARADDVAYRIPTPEAYGWAFARSMDPGGTALVSGVLLRDGLIYLLRDSTTQTGQYTTDTAARGSATSPYTASTITANASGVPLAVFLSEMNVKWRLWAAVVGINPSNPAGGPAYGGPVWEVAGSAIGTLQAAATAWGWLPL